MLCRACDQFDAGLGTSGGLVPGREEVAGAVLGTAPLRALLLTSMIVWLVLDQVCDGGHAALSLHRVGGCTHDRQGGQDREWPVGSGASEVTFTRPVVPSGRARLTRSTDQFEDTRRVRPLRGSDRVSETLPAF
jgi:hypothetical protein